MSDQGNESDSDDDDPATASVHVGVPAPDFQDWERTHLYFHDFANRLAHQADYASIQSSKFLCLGHVWTITLHKVFDELEFSFRNKSDESITFEVGISIKDSNDNKVGDFNYNYELRGGESEDVMRFITCQKALNNLVDNALVVEVRMRRPKYPEYPFIPKNPSACQTVRKLFMDKESADVVFEVGDIQDKVETGDVNASKKRKTESRTAFHAHSIILKNAAPLLAELCCLDESQPSAVIQIPNVSQRTFHHLLHYIYGRDIPDFGADISHTKRIIEAADRYGVTNLKIEAETYYVSSITMTLENVMEHLHFAHSKNLALLKERAIEFIVKNRIEILSKKTMTNAPGDLINEILAAVERESGVWCDLYKLEAKSISEIRRMAVQEGVDDIDGSRETLVAALEKHWAPSSDEEEKLAYVKRKRSEISYTDEE